MRELVWMAEGEGDSSFNHTYTIVAWNWKGLTGKNVLPETVRGDKRRRVAQCNSKVSNDIAWGMLNELMKGAAKNGTSGRR